MENLELFGDEQVPTIAIPQGKRKQAHPTQREMRAIKNLCDKGMVVQLSNYPTYHFTNKDTGEQEQYHITELLAEYDSDRRDENRAKAAAKRMEQQHERHSEAA